MTQSTQPGRSADQSAGGGGQHVEPTEMTGWVGWVAFAGTMMVLLGTFHVIEGIVALFRDQYFLVGDTGLTVHVSYTTWGWVHILGGIVVAAAGVFVFTGKVWARTVGVVVAFLSALVNLAFLASYPVWSALMIVIDVLVIWALTVHGSELKE
jgi:hypothetical protein